MNYLMASPGEYGLPEIELDAGDSESAVVPAVTPTADTPSHGRVANTNTAISNRSDNIAQRALFAGAHFEANCAPVFHFHGNFNFNWLSRLFYVNVVIWRKYHRMKKCFIGTVRHYLLERGVGGGEMM